MYKSLYKNLNTEDLLSVGEKRRGYTIKTLFSPFQRVEVFIEALSLRAVYILVSVFPTGFWVYKK